MQMASISSVTPAFTVVLLIQVFTDAAIGISWDCYDSTGSCYYLSDFKLAHSAASCWCRSVGGHLVKIDSAAELTLLRSLISHLNRWDGFYVGATDEKQENQYVWEDGSSDTSHIPWHDWGETTEPDNYGDSEHCAALTNKKWYEASPEIFAEYDAMDIGCHTEFYFVCEKNKGFLPSRQWAAVSLGLIFPSSEIKSYSGVSVVRCADYCARVCDCQSFAYKHDGGNCILYDKYFSRVKGKQKSPGFVHFD